MATLIHRGDRATLGFYSSANEGVENYRTRLPLSGTDIVVNNNNTNTYTDTIYLYSGSIGNVNVFVVFIVTFVFLLFVIVFITMPFEIQLTCILHLKVPYKRYSICRIQIVSSN